MKKILFTTVILLTISASAHSQIEKKTILLGSYADFMINTNEDIYFSLDPNFGYFVGKKFCIGLSTPVLYANGDFYWGFSPFSRFYFNNKDNNSLFISGEFSVPALLDIGNYISRGIAALGIGHVWFLNQSIGFETELQGSFNLNAINALLQVGFQIYLNRNNE